MSSELEKSFEEISTGGIYPVIGYGPLNYDSGQTHFVVLTTNIPELSYALKAFSRVAKAEYNLGRYTSLDSLDTLAKENPHTFRIHELRLQGHVQPTDVRDTAMLFGPSNWPSKAFALVDICGFSVLPPEEQVAYLLSLDNAVKSAVRRCRHHCSNLGISASFARSSTGDGYYLWHNEPGHRADSVVLALLVAIMVGSEAMRASGVFSMRLKGAFASGRVFVFPDRFPVELGTSGILQNAVGPVTNDLACLIEKARPSQILVKDFPSDRDPKRLLEEVKRLFNSEDQGRCELRFEPSNPSPPFRVIDKHGKAHRCWNLTGIVFNRFAGEVASVPQRIGLKPDATTDVTKASFHNDV